MCRLCVERCVRDRICVGMSYGIVGNGAYGGIIDRRGRVVWCCLEGFGGDPVFNSLLNNDSDEGGFFDVSIDNLAKSEQKYIPSSAVLITTLVSASGDVLQVKDFAPRYCLASDVVSRPSQLVRIVTRIRGDPVATIRVRPSFEYNSAEGYQTRGSHHIRYCGPNATLRLSTNAPIQQLMDESPFLVHEPVYLVFGADESCASDLAQLCRDYEDRTLRFWKCWSSSVALPVDYQETLLRNAITLQLLQADELGGIVSSLTLGVPLGADLPPTRDDRTFQLTDLCLSLPVMREFGLFKMAKRFLTFVKSIALQHDSPQAVYGYLGQFVVPPLELSSMAGYLGVGPALAGGMAANMLPDAATYGLIIVALSGAFFDARMKDLCSPKLFERMELFGNKAEKAFTDMCEGKGIYCVNALSGESVHFFEDDSSFLALPEKGVRARPSGPHTFTAVLCWAAADRLARVAEQCRWIDKSRSWAARAEAMREKILEFATGKRRDVITSFWGTDRVGPSVLRLAEIGFLHARDPLFLRTVKAFETDALSVCFSRTPAANRSSDWASLVPATPLQTSTLLWYIEALRATGNEAEARSLFNAVCASSNECGLLAQTIDLKDGRHWGNMPYASGIVGLLRVGSRLSRTWRAV